MKHPWLLLLVLAGCPGGDAENPERLWLALDGRETEVKLVAEEPDPY